MNVLVNMLAIEEKGFIRLLKLFKKFRIAYLLKSRKIILKQKKSAIYNTAFVL